MLTACTNSANSVKNAADNSTSRENIQYNDYISDSDNAEFGDMTDRDFTVNNVLHTEQYGDIHFSSYIPKSYTVEEPYALFVSLPGWEGLAFRRPLTL